MRTNSDHISILENSCRRTTADIVETNMASMRLASTMNAAQTIEGFTLIRVIVSLMDRSQRLIPDAVLILLLLLSSLIYTNEVLAEQPAFNFSNVQQIARERAAQAYSAQAASLPEVLTKLRYDQYRDIRYRATHALWHGQSMFEVQFFHLGFNFTHRVNISEVNSGQALPIAYSSSLFDFGHQKVPSDLPTDLGFAGFRVHFPLHRPAYKDEIAVFLGASYFRILGRNQSYGLSARGLALNTAMPNGEEFPYFTDFWLVRPNATQRVLTIYAILDGPSMTGAYQFEIRPGQITQVETNCELYARHNVEKVGIAPLTSMYLYGENQRRQQGDIRPEVHDSDGLMAHTGSGEWLWRPLVNSRELRVSRLVDDNPRGFGLIQRDRAFANYQDSESNYHARPSYWVEPLNNWGKGAVELVEIPSEEEIHDNIVAYWVSSTPITNDKPAKFSYLLSAFSESSQWPPGGKVVATRIGDPHVPGASAKLPKSMRRFVIDFTGGSLDTLDPTQPVKAELSAHDATIDDVVIRRIPASGNWQVSFRLTPRTDQPVDLRCYLSLYGEALTETWIYLWTGQNTPL